MLGGGWLTGGGGGYKLIPNPDILGRSKFQEKEQALTYLNNVTKTLSEDEPEYWLKGGTIEDLKNSGKVVKVTISKSVKINIEEA